MIATELARLLGADLGIESVEQISAEIEALASSHAGVTWARLRTHGARDGVVVPLPEPAAPEVTEPEAADETADAEVTESEAAEPEAAATDEQPGAIPPPPGAPTRPALVTYVAPAAPSAPALDAYSLRLVATRKLYDLGTSTQRSPSLASLVPGTVVRLNPYDFDRLGVDAGSLVTLTASNGAITLEAHPDAGVSKGSAAVAVNQGPPVGSLIDAAQPVTEIRVERA
jgi:predicted molibdopterin-dependent oxidoreductase YjgC